MRHRTLVLSLAGAALFACAGLARAQAPQLTPEQLQARADACVPPTTAQTIGRLDVLIDHVQLK